MSDLNKTIAELEFAQIGWVIPDIRAAVKLLSGFLGVKGFPEPEHERAQDLNFTRSRLCNHHRSRPSDSKNGILRYI